MKQKEDIIPILVPAIFAVFCLILGVLGLWVMLGPTFETYERDNFEFVDKGELPFSETLTEEFALPSSACECTEVHVYKFEAREGRTISFRIELKTLEGLFICIAESKSYEDCSLLNESVYEDEGLLEIDLLIPHDGQYFVLLRAGRLGEYQINMEDISE